MYMLYIQVYRVYLFFQFNLIFDKVFLSLVTREYINSYIY